MMSYKAQYQAKFRTPEDAVKCVKSGDWVDYGAVLSQPVALDKALAARKAELADVKIRAVLAMRPREVIECDPAREHFTYCTWYMGGYERKMYNQGRCDYIPLLLRNLPLFYRRELTPDVAMIATAPMDNEGYFNFSMSAFANKAVIEKAKIVIIEENKYMPYANGTGQEHRVHITDVDFIVRGDYPLTVLPSAPPDDDDKKAAAFIVEEIKNGSTIQLGIGGMPNAVGQMIADSDLKELGMHTEMLVDAYLQMHRRGKLTNLSKNIDKGLGVWAFGAGSQDLYDWVEGNSSLSLHPTNYVNDPYIMAHLDNFVSVNNCLEVDLFGQVSSESSGYRHISGTGGQLDFVTGAYMSKGGKSFICFKSTLTDKKLQTLKSRVVPMLPEGTSVTVPRMQVNYLVTEFGKVNLAGATVWERAERIISIAHPDFREELIKQAGKMQIWRKSNKR